MLKFPVQKSCIVVLLFCKFLKILQDAAVSKTKLINQEPAFFANSKISKMGEIQVDHSCCAKRKNITELLSIFFFYFHKSGNSVSLFVITITAIFVNCLILSSFYFPVEWNCFHWWWATHFDIFDSVLKIQPVNSLLFLHK